MTAPKNRKKRTVSPKRRTSTKRTNKSGKVYIPAYKTIMLCLGVIVLCLILLLINTFPKTKTEPQDTSITERFEDDTKKQEKLSSPEIPKKQQEKPAQTPEVQPQVKPQQEKPAKPVEPKKEPESKKPEATKKSFGFEKAKKNAQLIFVFDDGGQNLEQLKAFL